MSSGKLLRNLVISQRALPVSDFDKRKLSQDKFNSSLSKGNDSIQARMEYYPPQQQINSKNNTLRSYDSIQTKCIITTSFIELWQKRPSLKQFIEQKQQKTEEDKKMTPRSQIDKLKGLLNLTTRNKQKTLISTNLTQEDIINNFPVKQQNNSIASSKSIQQLMQVQCAKKVISPKINKGVGSQSERMVFKNQSSHTNLISQRDQDQGSLERSQPKNSLIKQTAGPSKSIPTSSLNSLLQSFKFTSPPKQQLNKTSMVQKITTSVCRQDEILDCATVLNKFSDQLTTHEKNEILDYKSIYYFGQNAQKVKTDSDSINYGYDNERGDYMYVINDHVAYRYEVIQRIGKGSFGQTFKVFDHKRKSEVALKIIRNKRKFHSQALIEITILKVLREIDVLPSSSLVKIKDYLVFRNHVCIVLELLSINLYEFLHHNKFNGVSLDLIRRFSIQLLQALMILEQRRIIHCDLKPENILLKEINKSGLKVIDFGSSCFENEKLYSYIQSRFYRAPEIILGLPYGLPIDMWSFGCIMAELYVGCPIFPSEHEKDHMGMLLEVFGMPPQKVLDQSDKINALISVPTNTLVTKQSQIAQKYANSIGTKPLEILLLNSPQNFVDFVRGCLTWSADDRMRPAEALIHEWILEGLPDVIKAQHLQSMRVQAPWLKEFKQEPQLSPQLQPQIQIQLPSQVKLKLQLQPQQYSFNAYSPKAHVRSIEPKPKDSIIKKANYNSFYHSKHSTIQGVQGESNESVKLLRQNLQLQHKIAKR